MKSSPPRFIGPRHDARSLALQVLLDCRRHEGFVQDLLDRSLTQHPLSPNDRRLATQLTYTVLRRRGTLHALLQPLVTRAPEKVETWLWDTLYLGACQLALLSQIPPFAAIHETVELAARFGRPGAKGFLNGVLRACAALLTADAAPGPAADALPLEGGTYRRLARPILPDPNTQPVDYLATGFALPAWLVERWLPRYGFDECVRLGFWFAGPAPLTLRVNALRTTREQFLAACVEANVSAEPGTHPQAVRLREHMAVRELPGYDAGWFTVQDESAMRVASALAPEPGATVLDLCSAPGGKTTHLAELMQNRGRIVACDIDATRLETVRTLAQRLGITIIETQLLHPDDETSLPDGPFDCALADVPCSNTGVLGRRPEVRWRLHPDDIAELVQLQRRLLKQASRRVRPGGALVYSTCSIEPEENQGVAHAPPSGLELEAEEASVPGLPADGGYWARLKPEKRITQ
jgi:16S rRNA (cytosine967-C5)-methyltransferase